MKKYNRLTESKPYSDKWITKFDNKKRNNYEVSNFKKVTINKLVQEEQNTLDVNDVIFLKNKENESLILIKREPNDAKEGMNKLMVYDFMYSKDRRIYTFYVSI